MTASLPYSVTDIITKMRRVTARPSATQLSDTEAVRYANTYYVFDMPEELRMESLRVNYQFLTNANTPAYDLPTSIYLDVMPPVYIAGYQSYMTQSRENFFRINPELLFLQEQSATYTGAPPYNQNGPFEIQCTATPILRGFKQNPPGAFSLTSVEVSKINWNVLVSAVDGNGNNQCLVDDGQGNLYRLTDFTNDVLTYPIRGTINYITGLVTINAGGFALGVPDITSINIQYIPYVASRPQSCVFFQDQILVYPIPDQAYTVSFEAYQYPIAFDVNGNFTVQNPQVLEWWQMIAMGGAMKIFEDAADFEMMAKYMPVLKSYEAKALRRTIVQQTSERTATIYTEQTAFPQYPFGNLFTGF